MSSHRFTQLDVFSARPFAGNPLAVVHDADDWSDERMAALARWTNLSETTFLLRPTEPGADYRVRIWTPGGELPFAGHPTLGSCHAWLVAGGKPGSAAEVVQQCGVGLVRIRRDGARLAFAAPPLRRSGPLDDATLAQARRALGLDAGEVIEHQWVDNGPGWAALRLQNAARVLSLQPDWAALAPLKLGVVGAHQADDAAGHDAQFEVRSFIGGGNFEDPVTGSLNAGLAQWLIGAGIAPPRYVAAQGAALGRAGRVHVAAIGDDVWIGGDVVVRVDGRLAAGP